MNGMHREHLEIVKDLWSTTYITSGQFLGRYTQRLLEIIWQDQTTLFQLEGPAKFYSPLSVEHFLKKSSIISMSRKGLEEIGRECALIANIEGLQCS